MKKLCCRVAFAALMTAAVLSAGCGYTTRSLIANQYRTIRIPPFSNKIDITLEGDTQSRYKVYRPMLETEVSKAVVDRFMFDGSLKVSSSDASDLVLEGELIEFRRDPLRFTSSNDVEEYRLNIVVNIRLRDSAKNALLWEERSFTGDATYFVSGIKAKSEDTAITDAIKDLARRIVERVVEQW